MLKETKLVLRLYVHSLQVIGTDHINCDNLRTNHRKDLKNCCFRPDGEFISVLDTLANVIQWLLQSILAPKPFCR